MKYDFDEVVSRENTNSMKWDVAPGVLPMWVADMDFKCAPAIQAAFNRRMENGVFGYAIIEDDWYQSYINWWKDRHHFEIQKEWMMFVDGIVPALSSMVRKLTTPYENVVIQTPVYNIFFNCIRNSGARILESPLKYDGEKYEVDFADLESKLADPQTTLMILCNPHNPVGKIWDRETLARIGALAKKHYVTVISDEIHCDLCDPGYEYVPFASVDDTCREVGITCISPTKAFNIAGIQTACIFTANPALRNKVNKCINSDDIAEPNVLAAIAPIAAFNESGEWLDELRKYLFRNKSYIRNFVREKLPMLKVIDSNATYLLWIDCSQICDDATDLKDYLAEKHGLLLNEGEEYGQPGKKFLRLNTATCFSRIEEGMKRLEEGVRCYCQEGGNTHA